MVSSSAPCVSRSTISVPAPCTALSTAPACISPGLYCTAKRPSSRKLQAMAPKSGAAVRGELGRLLVGFAVDRIFAPHVAIAILFACISGVLALAVFGMSVAVPAAFVIGFSVGAEVDLIGYLVARYFGMHAYGQIYGRQYATFLIATGLSPFILGAVRDATGSYTASLFTAAAFIAVSAALFSRLPKFEK